MRPAVLTVTACLLLGCSSGTAPSAGGPLPDGGAPTATGCAVATSCGGEPVGTWEFQSACLPGGVSGYTESLCPGSKWEDLQVSVSGSLVLSEGGGLMGTRRAVGTGKLTIPKSCFTAGVALDQAHCEDMAADTAGIGFDPSCTTDGARCVCMVNLTYSVVAKGSYDLAAGIVRFEGRPTKLCVSGATMQLAPGSDEDPMAFLFGLTRR